MKTLINYALWVLIIIFISIDFFQSYYYLENNGYFFELNPLINNRNDLFKVIVLKAVMFYCGGIILLELSEKYDSLKYLLSTLFSFFAGMNLSVIIRNFLVLIK